MLKGNHFNITGELINFILLFNQILTMTPQLGTLLFEFLSYNQQDRYKRCRGDEMEYIRATTGEQQMYSRGT